MSIIAGPTSFFCSACARERMYTHMTAEAIDPKSSIPIAGQFRCQPLHTAGSRIASIASANVHNTTPTVLNTASRRTCSESISVGRRTVERPTSAERAACLSTRAMLVWLPIAYSPGSVAYGAATVRWPVSLCARVDATTQFLQIQHDRFVGPQQVGQDLFTGAAIAGGWCAAADERAEPLTDVLRQHALE